VIVNIGANVGTPKFGIYVGPNINCGWAVGMGSIFTDGGDDFGEGASVLEIKGGSVGRMRFGTLLLGLDVGIACC
jgi:hypothetical protein